MDFSFGKNIAMYFWDKVGAYPFSETKLNKKDLMKLYPNSTICNYNDLSKQDARPSHLSVYQHLLKICTKKGVPEVKEFLSYLCTMDYLLGYYDRQVEDILFVCSEDGSRIKEIVPTFTPKAFEILPVDEQIGSFNEPCLLFAHDYLTNLDIVGPYSQFDLKILLSFADDVMEYLDETQPDMDDDTRLLIKEGLVHRISVIKRLYRHEFYKLDYLHKEDDEAKFLLRQRKIPESEDLINEVKDLKQIIKTTSGKKAARNAVENAVELIQGRLQATTTMDMLEALHKK